MVETVTEVEAPAVFETVTVVESSTWTEELPIARLRPGDRHVELGPHEDREVPMLAQLGSQQEHPIEEKHRVALCLLEGGVHG